MKHLLALALVLGIAPALASDLEREQRMAAEIVDSILDGDPVYLDLGDKYHDHEFLGIYTEADEPRGAVIVMHGRGFHPDWADTTAPLRVGLVDYGWSTLSIQMPVLQKEAKYNDYVPLFDESFARAEVALQFLAEQGFDRVVMIAHSCSVHMVNAWIKSGRFRGDAFVGIGMGATDFRQPMVDDWYLDRLEVPVLDVYGEADFPAVHRMAAERKADINPKVADRSRQVMVPGADHYFVDKGDELVEVVGDWLNGL